MKYPFNIRIVSQHRTDEGTFGNKCNPSRTFSSCIQPFWRGEAAVLLSLSGFTPTARCCLLHAPGWVALVSVIEVSVFYRRTWWAAWTPAQRGPGSPTPRSSSSWTSSLASWSALDGPSTRCPTWASKRVSVQIFGGNITMDPNGEPTRSITKRYGWKSQRISLIDSTSNSN